MKNTYLLMLLIALGMVSGLSGKATALAPFKKAFDAKYVKECDHDEFKKVFKKTGCNTCHVKKKKKDWLNLYGQELAKLIPGNAKRRLGKAKLAGLEARKQENQKLLKEMDVAMEKVGEMKSPSDATYEELFKSYQLPSPEGAKSLKEGAENTAQKGATKE